MNRFYVYKCIVDDGGAPCVDDGLLSLCICKPAIRSTARVGDVIFAFGSNSERPANRLVYIAEVTRRVNGCEYYDLEEFQDRQDCIYARTATGQFSVRPNATHHGTDAQMIRDIGTPPTYDRAEGLLSTNFRYFGASGTDDWKERSPALKQMIENLGQGHRINYTEQVRAELRSLRMLVWRLYDKKILGRPLHSHSQGCHDEDEPQVKRCGKRTYPAKVPVPKQRKRRPGKC